MEKRSQSNACVLANFFSAVEITTRETFRTSVFSHEIFGISLVVELGLPRTQALWFVYVIKSTWDGTRGRKTEKSIKLIHAAHAKATQAIEQHIAPGYEAGIRPLDFR
jgi:hypothetical protein